MSLRQSQEADFNNNFLINNWHGKIFGVYSVFNLKFSICLENLLGKNHSLLRLTEGPALDNLTPDRAVNVAQLLDSIVPVIPLSGNYSNHQLYPVWHVTWDSPVEVGVIN